MTHDTRTGHSHPRTATDRLVQALADPDRLFDRDQVLHLMATSQRWGYEVRAAEDAADPLSWHAGHAAGYAQRVAEEQASWPAPAVFSAETIAALARVQAARAAADADRSERYAGGPVPVWDDDRPETEPPAVSVRLVRTGAGWTWRDL